MSEADMAEPYIQIGDHVLTEAQAMAVRCAVTEFHTQVCDPEYARELGPIADGYKARLGEVLNIMLAKAG
jgi:hypothetical protein